MTHYVYRERPLAHRYYWTSNWCWWITWFLIFGFLITFTVLAFTTPYPPHEHYYKATAREECSPSERFDDELRICTPITHLPTAVSPLMMDTSVLPCHSFFRRMNGAWIKNHTNEDRAFSYLYRKNRAEVHMMIRDPASGPIYKFYRSCRDTLVHKQHTYETHKQRKHVTEHILGALKTHADLPVVLGRLAKYGFNGPFSLEIEAHPTERRSIALIRFDAVPGLETELTKQLSAWHAEAEPTDFEGYVLGGQFAKDVVPMSKLEAWAPQNFWKQYLDGLKLKDAWVLDQGYVRRLLEQMNAFPIEQWKEIVKGSIAHNMDDFLPAVPADSYFREHTPIRRLEKKHKGEITEEHCLAVTHKLLPGLIAQEFLHRSMRHSEQIRGKVTALVESLRDAYAQLLHETRWLSVRDAAVEKVQSIIVRAVHPNTWEQEPFALRLSADRYLRNLNMIRRYRVQRNRELLGASRDAAQRFGAPLTTTNAYYSPQSNTITVFAGIVRKPLYSQKFDRASLYATLGMVIGHELSHAFDNTGRLFDKEGNLRRWWPESDVKEFERRAQCVVNEYGPPQGCNNAKYGTQTLGEDIADITGITIAYRAFNNGNPTDAERMHFFEIFAQMWASSYDQKHRCGQVENDVHAIARFRVDHTLRQIPEFARLFRCHAGDKMVNRSPCKIYG